MSAIEERFRELHPTSEGLAAQARHLFPDGVTHVSRKLAPYPVYMDRGKGPRKWDIDGNEYVDYRTGHGSMILGQAHPAIVDAVPNPDGERHSSQRLHRGRDQVGKPHQADSPFR